MRMACPKKLWLLCSLVLMGCVLSLVFFYSFLNDSVEPRTHFIHRFQPPGLLRDQQNPWPPAEQPHAPLASPIPPLPTEPIEFLPVRPYSDLVSAASSFTAVEDAFYKRMSVIHVRCSPMPHLGRNGDGGWEVCLAKSFRPEKPCLVYDFGVDNIWEFDEAMARDYGCTVRAFDPSMGRGDFRHFPGPVQFYDLGLAGSSRQLGNGWRLWTMPRLLQRFGEQLRTIDVLKLDIEYYEWEALQQMLTTTILTRTKQLLLEVHTHDVRGTPPSKEQLLLYHNVLDRLEALGFRKFHSHANPRGKGALAVARRRVDAIEMKKSEQLGRTCCFELHYINSNFAKDRRGLEVV